MKSWLPKQYKKLTVIALTLIFIIPMVSAWLSFTKGWFLIANKVNHGVFLERPFFINRLELTDLKSNLVEPQLKGKWWLIYFSQNIKNNLSQRNLYYMRQIRQATGKERERIERAIITLNPTEEEAAWVHKNYPGTNYFIISKLKLSELESNLPKKLALEKGSLYLVDPLGNIVLFYPPDAAPKGILKDLQRVLKVSQIG